MIYAIYCDGEIVKNSTGVVAFTSREEAEAEVHELVQWHYTVLAKIDGHKQVLGLTINEVQHYLEEARKLYEIREFVEK